MNDLFPGEGRKKITSLFGSQRRLQRSASISTAAVDKDDLLRKSRIVNLPNYKKEQLDNKLNFVVVFQTIEIQRLSVEIESLRVRLTDRERQIFNYQNYEVQIRQLTQRCFELQSEKAMVQEELRRLKSRLRQTENENQKWKSIVGYMEDQFKEQEDHIFELKEKLLLQRRQRQQSQQGRLMLESTIKHKDKQYDRQMRDIEKSTQSKRTQLTKNEQHLGNLIKKYQQEVNSLQKQNSSIRSLYENLEMQSQDLQHRYEQLQERLYRCSQTLKDKQIEIEGLEQENRERLQLLQVRYQQEYNSKSQRLIESEKEIYGLKDENQKLEFDLQKMQLRIAQDQQQAQKYEMLLNGAGDEIDRLNSIIKDKIKYLQAWQNRYKELQATHNDMEAALSAQMHKSNSDAQEITRLSMSLKYKTEQLEKLEKVREMEARAVKAKLEEIQQSRMEINAIRREKEAQKEQQKRNAIQNRQLKQQLNKKIIEGNQLFDDLNKAEVQIKQLKQQLSSAQTVIKINQEELLKAKTTLASVDSKIDKLYTEKRTLEQDVVKVKALQQRGRHEEARKNEYLSQCKKLTHRLKETEKRLIDSQKNNEQLEKELDKFQRYTQQLVEKVKEQQNKLDLMQKLKRQITTLLHRNDTNEHEIEQLRQAIDMKMNELNQCKQKILQFGKWLKQYKNREEQYQKQLQYYDKLEGELRALKGKYQQLQDKKQDLQTELAKVVAEAQSLSKQNGSLQRFISINTQEIQRDQQQLTEAKQSIFNLREKQKQYILKLKDGERKIKSMESAVEKEKERLNRERSEIQKQFQKRVHQNQTQFKGLSHQKTKLLEMKIKELKQLQNVCDELKEENDSFRVLIKKFEQDKERLNKTEKELQKKILNYEHEIQRITDTDSQSRKQLKIALSKIDKLILRVKELQQSVKDQGDKVAELLAQNQRLLAEISDNQRQIASKQSEAAQLLHQNKLFQKQLATLNGDYGVQQDKNAQLCTEILKLKYQSQQISTSYNNLNVRLQNTEKLIFQLKGKLTETIKISSSVQEDKRALESKYLDYQQRLAIEIDRLEEQQFKANQQIIRLDTMNKILQIELGQYKERQSAVFSIVKESSTLNERKDVSPVKQKPKKQRKSVQSPTLDSDYNMKPLETTSRRTSMHTSRAVERESLRQSQLLKSSLFGDITPIKKSRCGTTKLEDDLVQISYCDRSEKRDSAKGQNPLSKSKNPIYFQNLVLKQI